MFTFVFAKFLEVIGLLAVLVGIFVGVVYDSLSKEFYYAIIGIFLFYTGRMMEKKIGK
jgi:hypothetical protein